MKNKKEPKFNFDRFKDNSIDWDSINKIFKKLKKKGWKESIMYPK